MSVLTESRPETTRRLQLLGFAPEVIDPLITYVQELNYQQFLKGTTVYTHLLRRPTTPEDPEIAALTEWFDVDPTATGAGKYVQVVQMSWDHRTDTEAPRSVHSVVVKATGQVCKSAGWKQGPAKSTAKATRGQLLSRYTLTDPDSLSALLAALDVHGGYLYQGR